MDIGQILSWVVGAVGLIGFYFAGQKAWWSWYINLVCQVLWISYALVTGQPAFLVTAAIYSGIFGVNAYKWTKDHLLAKKNWASESKWYGLLPKTSPHIYRKKPVAIEARRFTVGAEEVIDNLILWITGNGYRAEIKWDSEGYPDAIMIHTLEGWMRADIGDWIIRGVNGEFYPCKPDIFDKTYESVSHAHIPAN